MPKNTIPSNSPAINVTELRKELEGIRAITDDLRVMLDKSTPHPTLDHNVAMLDERVSAIDSLLNASVATDSVTTPAETPAAEVPQS